MNNSFNNDVLLDSLKSKSTAKTENTSSQQEIPEKIFSKLKVFSESVLTFPDFLYYKFPFTQNLRKKNCELSTILSQNFNKALISVFNNYMTNNTEFKLIFIDRVWKFENDAIICDAYFENMLINNDIGFLRDYDDKILKIVENIDKKLVLDLILNADDSINFRIPFILSRYQFFNSIFYNIETRLKNRFKEKGKLKYCYVLEGEMDSLEIVNKIKMYNKSVKDINFKFE